MTDTNERLAHALWQIYRRPERPELWKDGGNLPWDEPGFSRRMLREHLDDGHGAASRAVAERQLQLDWLWDNLALQPGAKVLDITCGPGLYAVELADRGCTVHGVDFSPAAIAFARDLAQEKGVSAACTFLEQDVRGAKFARAAYDAVLILYGQLAVFPPDEAAELLVEANQALRPGGRLCVELLDQEKVDKADSNWWFTDQTGLWGEAPFLHLGERFWDGVRQTSVERYQILHLETGRLEEITLCDQTYAVKTMRAMMRQAGLLRVNTFPAWDGLPLYDADEWIVYIGQKGA
jgi:SAM-dependent methyltransferase